MGRYRLLVGQHAGTDTDDIELAKEEDRKPKDRIYSAGEIVDSESNLAERYPEKFALVDEGGGGEQGGRRGRAKNVYASKEAQSSPTPTTERKMVPSDVSLPHTGQVGVPRDQSQGGFGPTQTGGPGGSSGGQGQPKMPYNQEELEGMTKEELHALAEDNEIENVKMSDTKAEMIKAIQKHNKG